MSLRDAFKKTHVQLYTATAIAAAASTYGFMVSNPNIQTEFSQIVDIRAIRNDCQADLTKEYNERILPVAYEFGSHIAPQMVEKCVTDKYNGIFNGLKIKHFFPPVGGLAITYGLLYFARRSRRHSEQAAAPALEA